MIQFGNGNYVLVGAGYQGRACVALLSEDGELIWFRRYEREEIPDVIRDVAPAADGNIVVCSAGSGIKIDIENGDVIWREALAEGDGEFGDVRSTGVGGFIFSGIRDCLALATCSLSRRMVTATSIGEGSTKLNPILHLPV